ncbi:TonB-dependent receptor plug domain-containing protein [Phenylobacterium sp.]|uniref:TonB-dependent receptor plug domain-containing protein n=1 Tax=Phenylobacterium sp. TaxID=1871053 RepID=UPI00374D7B25
MPRYLLSASLLALATAIPLTAFAADAAKPTTVDDLIVTGTRDTEGASADKIAGSITVITAQDFADRQVRIVSDVLRDVPGVAVGRTGAVGSFTQVRIRGTEGNQVLTLIDGIKASDPFFGEFDYATLLADDVARVEVLRGQQSAIYGSDAIGGVINYITPTGRQQPGVSASGELGTMGTWGAHGRAAGYAGGFDYAVSAGYQKTDGYVVAPGGSRDIGSELGAIAAKVAYDVTEHLKLRGVARYTDTRADSNGQAFSPPGFATDSPGSETEAKSKYGFLAADYDLLEGRWTHSLSVQGVDATRDNTSGFARTGGDKGTRVKWSYATTFRIETGDLTHKFTGAYDHERETYQNTNPPGAFAADTTRRAVSNDGFVGQYDLTVADRAGLMAAVRYDRNDLFDNATTYRVQGYYKITDMVRVRAAAGSGIKNPSQTQLFGYNATAFPFVGNPNLKPGRSEGWEAGADFAFNEGRVRLGATYFDSTLHDEIYSVFGAPVALCTRAGFPVPTSCSTTGNRATDSTQKGVELFANARLSDAFTLDAAYTDLNAKENGVKEIRRPDTIASANLTWRAPSDAANMTLTVRYNGQATDRDFSAFPARTVALKAYTLVNLAGALKLNPHLEIYGRVENLANARYQDVYGYQTPGRAAYGGVRLRF